VFNALPPGFRNKNKCAINTGYCGILFWYWEISKSIFVNFSWILSVFVFVFFDANQSWSHQSVYSYRPMKFKYEANPRLRPVRATFPLQWGGVVLGIPKDPHNSKRSRYIEEELRSSPRKIWRPAKISYPICDISNDLCDISTSIVFANFSGLFRRLLFEESPAEYAHVNFLNQILEQGSSAVSISKTWRISWSHRSVS